MEWSINANIGAGTYDRGGGVRITGGILRNCTVLFNSAYWGGGVYLTDGGTVVNCIIYSNTAYGFDSMNTNNVGGLYAFPSYYTYCCAPELTTGTGNITNAPLFTLSGVFPYSLANASPCIDAGLNQTWMTNEVDLAGNHRIIFSTVDIGAYESSYNRGVYYLIR